MKIAVAGASGGVGKIVTNALRRSRHQVRGIDRNSSAEETAHEWVTADLTEHDQTLEALKGVDVIVNLAGLNGPIPLPEWEAHNTNVVISYNVLSAAAKLGIHRVVQASSVNAIGLAWSRSPSFDYFPVDLQHRSRTEDGYSLSKLIQELQADSVTRRHDGLSVISLRLHAVLNHAAQAQIALERLGPSWAINGLFGYCTEESVVDAIERACSASVIGHEVLWVVEPETLVDEDSRTLAARFYPDVPFVAPMSGRASFFDTSRTREILGWTPSTEDAPPTDLITL
ncbi:NAD-dependent epimerase/dehydratase family protein [Paramicrobacterium chengjingii]|uniref:NAD-dependent epimerase/dehydratase family protein n=1 Tax=Paramicrobacterium chengjingii TaxID=2769067 RepID=UPI00142025C4|nr:NAD(P)-dependent oxidoreductase [Microbacterium chengjingii]